ncbi:hypothetical protein SAMN05216343_102159 [Oscillibacter sp. PC13]|uniref:hypothetical protein n=1 Tax=Oscillibacter sp. PC13 TaxID=1855299 RepID=UPI0008E16E10|nr:hypothetical protein [Oscillibacter sp. PC13]SFP05425.1 hypothetical protein SAMN05216343_102159 [Oscillibacter sp. PC13]
MKCVTALLASLLLLTSCSAPPEAASSLGAAQKSNGAAVQAAVTSEEEVRALYAADTNSYRAVQSVTPYEGDFLVCLGDNGYPTRFDWVYGATGIRRPLAFDYEGVVQVEILDTASIQALTDGVSTINGYRSFPHWVYADLSGLYDGTGQTGTDYDPYAWPPTAYTEPYWAAVTEPHSFGMFGRREAVSFAQVECSGFALSFAPLADGSDFSSAFCAPPGTDIAYDALSRTLTVTCRDTFLDSGELDPAMAEAGYTAEWLQENNSLYPEDFPSGSLAGSCPLVESAAIAQVGNDAVVTLVLMATDDPLFYTVEEGYQGPADTGPYFRLKLRAGSW